MCSSMHGCKARHLGVGHKGFASLFHYHHKGLVKPELDSMQRGTNAGSDSYVAVKGDHAVATISSNEDAKDSRSTSAVEELKNRNGAKFSGVVAIKPLNVSVSWRVPRKSQDNNSNDKHPGFYSDYSRPRTRPPSHN
ncbi:hypothetical protein FNV43_RR24244 [Rhamnella rubrinervis]|uniref:Uncharacterized protein n=1 Tax=Rhamnella rubrinervis TaxID=2594499 RepID=A0A8K0DL52_9ROSA|nr:hypothetical protein FNV43_RR24244 [Rhamnella rubrinervis]